jgi:hypothetical protein
MANRTCSPPSRCKTSGCPLSVQYRLLCCGRYRDGAEIVNLMDVS